MEKFKQNSPLKRIVSKYIFYFTYLFLFLNFVLPYGYIYSHNSEFDELKWTKSYVYQDINLILFFLVYTFLTVSIDYLKNKSLGKKLLFVHLIISFIFSSLSFLSILLISQDYMPGIGNFLSIFLFPLSMSIYISKKEKALNLGP